MALFRAMGRSVDHTAAHAADAFPAIIVEFNRFFAVQGQAFIDHIQHFQKRHVGMDVIGQKGFKAAPVPRTFLAPDLQCYSDGIGCVRHL